MKDTRQAILKKNFEAMHRHGFQGLRADQVIQELGITKGAFYHYFPNKAAVGYAVVDELLMPRYLGYWNRLYDYIGHPVEGIVERLKNQQHELLEEDILLGCPLTNLIQEMAPLDQGFRERLSRITEGMHLAIHDALTRGQRARLVNPDIHPDKVAFFILSTLQGAFSLTKARQDRRGFDFAMEELIGYLRTMK